MATAVSAEDVVFDDDVEKKEIQRKETRKRLDSQLSCWKQLTSAVVEIVFGKS